MSLRAECCGETRGKGEELDPRYRQVAEIFSRHPAERLLDVCCGDGRFTSLLGEVAGAKEVYGLEISAQGTELAKKAGVKAIQLDVDSGNLPFEDAFFDAVFCGEVIEHLYDPDHLLEEVYRVLKDGGLLVLSTSNLAWWVNRIALALGFYPYSISPSLRHPLGHVRELPLLERGFPVFSDYIRKPLIGSNVGGIPAQIKEGWNGFLVEPGNERQLAEKITYLVANPQLRKEMGENSRRLAEERFDWRRMAEELNFIYREMASPTDGRGDR